MYAVRWK